MGPEQNHKHKLRAHILSGVCIHLFSPLLSLAWNFPKETNHHTVAGAALANGWISKQLQSFPWRPNEILATGFKCSLEKICCWRPVPFFMVTCNHTADRGPNHNRDLNTILSFYLQVSSSLSSPPLRLHPADRTLSRSVLNAHMLSSSDVLETRVISHLWLLLHLFNFLVT